jgi:hypothetical protein
MGAENYKILRASPFVSFDSPVGRNAVGLEILRDVENKPHSSIRVFKP